MYLDEWKTLMEAIQSGATSLGIAAVGLWTWWLFVRQRLRFPRAKVSHTVEVFSASSDSRLLDVGTCIENTGSRLIKLGEVETRVQQVLPLSPDWKRELERHRDLVPKGETEIPWPLIGTRSCEWKVGRAEVEPGESETVHCDFVIPADVEVVRIYSYIPNQSKRRGQVTGWPRVTFLRLNEGGRNAKA